MNDFKKDYVFKEVFGQESTDSKEALRTLIQAFLNKPVHNVQVISNEPKSKNKNQKGNRFDILTTINNGIFVGLEMQVQMSAEELDRFEYYATTLINMQDIQGFNYSKLNNIYLFLFINKHYYRNSAMIQEHIVQSSFNHFNRLINIITIEMPKLPKKRVEDLTEQEAWIYLFRHGHKKRYQKRIKKLAKKWKGVELAMERNMGISSSSLDYLFQKRKELFDYKYINKQMKKQFDENLKTLDATYQELQSKNQELNTVNQELQSKKQQLQSKDQEIQSKDQEIQSKDQEIQSKEQEIQSKEQEIQSKDQEIQRLKEQLAALQA